MITINNMDDVMPSDENEFDVRVDRKTIFGNPFRINDESERDQMLDKYEEYFHERVKNDPEFRDAANHLVDLYKKHGKLNFFCWCYPKRCHSETIRAYILSAVNSQSKQ